MAPPSAGPNRLTAHSFIDEEIVALAAAGVECVVVSDAIAPPPSVGAVPVVPVPVNPGTGEIAGVLRFAARHAPRIPWTTAGWELMHALRIEEAAARAIAAHRIDVIHSHFAWPAGFGGALAAAETGVPLIASLRGMDLLASDALGYGLRRDAAFARALRRLLATATRTVYATEFMRTAAIDAGAPDDRTIVIRKGVDLGRFHPAADRRLARRSLGLGAPVILAVGTLIPRKRHDLLIDALAPLADRPWTLVICGEGPDRPALEAQALALGVGDRVRFAGQVDRDAVARHFSAADIFVHPAALEAAGNVILEALASGVPVVCTDAGGPREYVVDGQTGFVVPADDRRALTAQIRLLLEQPALRAAVSLAARTTAERVYDYRRMVGDYADVYERCARGSLPSRGVYARFASAS
jgi:glycosyltransferase involved in cell wall biosynthesis